MSGDVCSVWIGLCTTRSPARFVPSLTTAAQPGGHPPSVSIDPHLVTSRTSSEGPGAPELYVASVPATAPHRHWHTCHSTRRVRGPQQGAHRRESRGESRQIDRADKSLLIGLARGENSLYMYIVVETVRLGAFRRRVWRLLPTLVLAALDHRCATGDILEGGQH